MERAMSVEDKIRRAEEIYYQRRNQTIKEPIKNEIKTKKDFKLLKKMLKQIIICLLLYTAFYLLTNNNYIFSEDLTNKIKEVISQDINFSNIYNSIFYDTKEKEETKDATTVTDTEDTDKEEIQNNNENIGGAEETPPPVIEEKNEEKSQMEQDAHYIKSNISFIKPVEGRVSSMFGLRNPTTSTVPKNHTGTDIAAVTGTKIVSATDGKVIYKSSKGDYGKHLKIQVNDVIVLYAHCNKIYVNEGDIITQGQEIAEVGSTGNTTGPHLHFEIRYQERRVDPQLILEL